MKVKRDGTWVARDANPSRSVTPGSGANATGTADYYERLSHSAMSRSLRFDFRYEGDPHPYQPPVFPHDDAVVLLILPPSRGGGCSSGL